MANGFRYSEARLADCIGVARPDLKGIRDRRLKIDRDWKKVGGEIALSNAGLRMVWHALQIRPHDLDLRECLILNGAKKNGAHSDGPAVGEKILLGSSAMPIPALMRVTRIPANPSLVLCHDQHARLCSVWVGKNENFIIGMQLQAAQGGDGMWRLMGPRPRLKGRWK